MKIKETVGIDVSKLTLDAFIHTTQQHGKFNNDEAGFKKLIKWVFKDSQFKKVEVYFLLEHTGKYAIEVVNYLSKKSFLFNRIPALVIKKSMGIVRSKSDKLDAKVIAKYAYRLRDEIKETGTFNLNIQQLQSLTGLMENLVKKRAGLKSSLKENQCIPILKEIKSLTSIPKRLIKQLNVEIKNLQKEIFEIIKNDENLSKIYKLITSIKGIGPKTAIQVIIYTEGFTKFLNARKFASFCGIAPFQNQSGTSLKGKTKVSNYANKKLKKLLHMCARSAIQHCPEMRQFYNRRIGMGKHSMSTINVVRNKLVSRMFAVIKRGTPYVDTYKYAA